MIAVTTQGVSAAGGWLAVGLIAVAVLLAPGVGLRAQWHRWRRQRRRSRIEDALKHLLDCEHSGRRGTVQSLSGALGLPQRKVPELVRRMERRGLTTSSAGTFHLTPDGERWALHVVRAHRLWERYLADEANMPLQRVHRAADWAEHHLTDEQLDALDAHMGYPATDPHGDPIPTAAGKLARPPCCPLTDWPSDRLARIVHIEDEPDTIFRQIMAEGLRPGRFLRVLESSPERLVISSGELEHRLAPVVAANIQVAAAEVEPASPPGAIRLSELPRGRRAEVVALDADCRGFSRRRLLDMGITPGTTVRPELTTAMGDPRAIRVRGTMIALRREQMDQIWVRPTDGDGHRPAGAAPAAAEVS